MKTSTFLFSFIFLSNKSKEINTERGRNGIQETKDLAEKRGEGNSQNGDKEISK